MAETPTAYLTRLLAATKHEYPTIAEPLNAIKLKASPVDSTGRKLEFYPPSESENPNPGKPTVETFGRNVRPQDVAGDVVSHYLGRGVDPALTGYYKNFVSSLTPKQQSFQHDRYAWSQKNEGETRPYAQWAQVSGNPDFFRGYPFQQWGQNAASYYTPAQRENLGMMLRYLQGPSAYAHG